MDQRVATRLAEVAGSRAAEAASALEVLVRELCTTPVGVTAIRDPDVAWDRHVLDALRAVEELDECPPGPVVDVGSGGGIPGLVLGVVRPERPLHLVEATARKADFLRETALRMGVDVTRPRCTIGGSRAGRRPPPRHLRVCVRTCARGASGRRGAMPPARRAGRARDPVARAVGDPRGRVPRRG